MARSHSTSRERKELKEQAKQYKMTKAPKSITPHKDLNKFPLSFVAEPLKEGPLLLFMPPGNCILSDFTIKSDVDSIELNLEVDADSFAESKYSAYNIDFNSNDSPADIKISRGDRLVLSVTGESRRTITGLVWISFYYRSI
jgi:hypothetical protein